MIYQLCLRIIKFWIFHPALFYGLALVTGFSTLFYSFILIFIVCTALWMPFLILICFKEYSCWKSLSLNILLVLSAVLFAKSFYEIPDVPKKGISGQAYLAIENIHLQKKFFTEKWIYQCQLLNFVSKETNKSIAKHLKCTLSLPVDQNIIAPSANKLYLVEGILFKSSPKNFYLKVNPELDWKIVDESWGLVEDRLSYKDVVSNGIKGRFDNPLSGTFLSGLITGDFNDQMIKDEFGRLGLQHLMSISGFHFAIIVGFFSLFFRLIFSRKVSIYFLLLSTTLYAVFLGSNPSILRAWIMCSMVLLASLLEKKNTPLNALGIALIVVVLFDPWLIPSMGFQFSFLITASILLFYAPVDKCLRLIFPKRELSVVVEMDRLNQHGYCLIAFFRQALSLTVAVNLIAIPLTLYYFGQFPVWGLLYNLFFPFLVSISMLLLLIGAVFAWIPLIGSQIDAINNSYTNAILKMTYQLPNQLDHYLVLEYLPDWFLLAYVSVIFLVFINLKGKLEEAQEDVFIFI